MKAQGFFFKGTIVNRSRQFLGEDKKELVTYKAQANGREYYIKHWEPNDNYYGCGDYVEIPVFCKPYCRNNATFIDYVVVGDLNSMKGESF